MYEAVAEAHEARAGRESILGTDLRTCCEQNTLKHGAKRHNSGQLVILSAHNPKVGGSNPPTATKGIIGLRVIVKVKSLSKTVQQGKLATVSLVY